MDAARLRKAFERNARGFTDHLSSLFTRTITDVSLGARVLPEDASPHTALIRFQDADRRPTELGLDNGCRVRILQRIVPHTEKPEEKVTTAEYSYVYGFGENLDEGWLVRYDYVPEMAERDKEKKKAERDKEKKYEYPVGHVHFNGYSEAYDAFEMEGKKQLDRLHFPTKRISLEDFIEHLVVEMGVSTKFGKDEARRVLAESRETFQQEKRTKGY